jgi:hypothetical protein
MRNPYVNRQEVAAPERHSPSQPHRNLVAVRDGSGSVTEFVDVKDWLKTLSLTKESKEGDLDPITYEKAHILDFLTSAVTQEKSIESK